MGEAPSFCLRETVMLEMDRQFKEINHLGTFKWSFPVIGAALAPTPNRSSDRHNLPLEVSARPHGMGVRRLPRTKSAKGDHGSHRHSGTAKALVLSLI